METVIDTGKVNLLDIVSILFVGVITVNDNCFSDCLCIRKAIKLNVVYIKKLLVEKIFNLKWSIKTVNKNGFNRELYPNL